MSATTASPRPNIIYCPSIKGLTPSQADLAIVMPRIDHNRAVRENPRQGDWAALMASDPFGSETAMFGRLREIGYSGVTNWPSSILLEGSLRQSMASIPASPEFEYAFLSRAREAGLQSMAFFRSLEQARAALEAGLNCLVLHPGLLSVDNPESGAMVHGSLKRLVENIKSEAPEVSLFAYTSQWHERVVELSSLPVRGLIWCEAET